MKKICLMIFLLYAGFNYAQGTPPKGLRSLKVGDRLPDLPMAKVLVNGKVISMNTGDYKDKLLILDFWDTFCGSCIDAFPRMDEVQKSFGDKIQIIPVTYQQEDVIRKFKANNKIGGQISLPMMIEDNLLKDYFPHRFVSHTVWINKGEVIAISNSQFLDKSIVTKVLNGEKINLPVKDDFVSYDFKNSSLLGASTATSKNIYSAITQFKERATASGSEVSSIKDSINGTVKDVFLNYPIARLYIKLLFTIKPVTYKLKSSMIIVEAKQPANYDMNYMNAGSFSEEWMRQHAICYESVLPGSLDNKERAKLMIADLDNKLGLHGRMEKRSQKVWVIKPLKGMRPAYDESKDGKTAGKQEFNQFMLKLTYDLMLIPEFANFLPVIDESNMKPTQSMDMYVFKDSEGFKRALNLNGLDLIEEMRPFETFVLTETRN